MSNDNNGSGFYGLFSGLGGGRAVAILFGTSLLTAPTALAITLGRERVTSETAHFFITVDRKKTKTAAEAAAWLEQAWQVQSEFYAFDPEEKIQVALLDEEDFSNGYAYAANSWVVLYLPPARFTLRGPSQWMPNVAAHELAHIFTLRKMGVTSRFLGAEAFVSLGRQRGRIDADIAWLPDEVPGWIAEGLAQYGAMHMGYDTLESRRRMLLREAWASGTLRPLKAMEAFSGDARDGEMIYNQGFFLTDFIYRTYGREAVNTMMEAWDEHGYHGAFQRAFGASPGEIDALWRAELDARFAREGVAREEMSPFDAYRLETAMVRDTVRDVLYTLSSRANDYGITHLYARENYTHGTGRPRLIRRDVNPPLSLAPDGSLLFSSNRYDMSTGANRVDVYRYDPRTRIVTRVTQGRRAFAGAQAGGHVYVLIQNVGRTRLARLTRRGVPERWVDPPAGAEFSSLAPGDDSTLYVTAARGGHADILKLDLRTGTLAAAEASPAHEIDPHFSGGRLYFASDRSGEQAVYSRAGDSLIRHTPPGASAFSPFVSKGFLHYSEYAAAGFRARAIPLQTVTTEISPAETSGTAHAAPPLARIRNLKSDRAGVELLGYYGTLGYAYTPHADVYGSLYGGESRDFRLNPCGHQGYAGGGTLWADPAQRHQLTGAFLAGRCMEPGTSGGTWLPFAGIEYVNGNFAPLLIIMAQYQSELLANPNDDPSELGAIHNFQTGVAASYALGNYARATPFFQIGGSVAYLPGDGGTTEGGAGLAAGGILSLAALEPGKDFINQGLYTDLTAAVAPGTGIFAAAGGLFTNVQRALFLGAHGDVFQATADAESFDAGFSVTADAPMPLGATLGTAGYRGLHLESMFLRAGYAVRADQSEGITLAYAATANGIRALQNRERPGAFRDSRQGASPVAQIREVGPQTVLLGLRVKAVSPGSRLVYWDLQWQAPPDAPGDGYFSVSLSL